MNLNHLAIFHAVAVEKSISLGAERLCISQPAVSKQLKEFEESLGVKLFDRHSKGVRLTEAGAALAVYAKRIASLESEAELAVSEIRGLARGRLTIGASLTIGGYLLPTVIVRFHECYPGIEIDMEIANTEVIQHKLLEGVIDIGFTEGYVEIAELDAQIFSEDELVPIAAPNHPIFRETPVTIGRLCQEPFVLRESGSGTREVVERAIASRACSIKSFMSLGDIEAVKRAVAAGECVGFSSRRTIDMELELGKVRVIDVEHFQIKRPLHLLRLRGKYETNASKAFVETLKESH